MHGERIKNKDVKNMFSNTNKPLRVFGPFYSTILRGPYTVLCAVTIMYSADLRSLSICLVSGRMCISSVCVCVLGPLVSGRSQTDLPLTRAPSTHTNR